MSLYSIKNPHFYFDCSFLVWYATQNAEGEFTSVTFRNGNIYR